LNSFTTNSRQSTNVEPRSSLNFKNFQTTTTKSLIVNSEKTRIKRGIKKDLNDSNKTKKKRNSFNYQDAGIYQTNLNQVFHQENYSNIVFDKNNNFSFTDQNGQNFF